jgi:hypothetical protein
MIGASWPIWPRRQVRTDHGREDDLVERLDRVLLGQLARSTHEEVVKIDPDLSLTDREDASTISTTIE